MSDATLRELERATRDDTAGQAWARLALARARAGLDGRRAAVQALLRDPAAPVRELLPRDDVPAPRALAEVGPDPLRVPTGILRQPPKELVDLGRGRALLVALDELVAVDLFAAEVLWRRSKGQVASVLFEPSVVGEWLVGFEVGPALRVVWASAATGRRAGSVELPGDVDELCPTTHRIVPLGGARCVHVVCYQREAGWRATWLDLAEGRVLGAAQVPDLIPPDAVDLEPRRAAAAGAFVVARGQSLEAWEPAGMRWTLPLEAPCEPRLAGGDLVVASVGGARLEVVSAASGLSLSSVPFVPRAAVVAGQLLAVVEPRPGGDDQLVGVAARTGERRWVADLTLPRDHTLDLHAAGDVIVVVRKVHEPERWRVVETTALDRDTGQTLWSRRAQDLDGDECAVRSIGGLLVAIGPASGWIRKHTPLRCSAPAP
jgi:hypothetical protein